MMIRRVAAKRQSTPPDRWLVAPPVTAESQHDQRPCRIGELVARLFMSFDDGAEIHGLSALFERDQFLTASRQLVEAVAVAEQARTANGHVVVGYDGLAEQLASLFPDSTVTQLDEAPRNVPSRQARKRTRGGSPTRSDDPPLVVIVGSGRNGSTWLTHLLSAAGDVAATPHGETWLFANVSPLSTASPEVRRAARRFCDAAIAAGRERYGETATWFVEKTPRHTFLLPWVTELYPAAHLLHLVRDGREVADSYVRLEIGPDTVGEAAQIWAAATSAAAHSAGQARSSHVRYESLTTDPETEVQRLWAEIGVNTIASDLNELRRRVGTWISPHRGTSGRGEGWRSWTTAQRAEFDSAAGDVQRRLGYGSASSD